MKEKTKHKNLIKVPVKFHFKDGSVIEQEFFLAKNHNDYLNEAKMSTILEWINKILTFSDKDFFNMVKISSGDYEQKLTLSSIDENNIKSSQMLATEAVYVAISMSNSNMFNVNATGSNDIEECILFDIDPKNIKQEEKVEKKINSQEQLSEKETENLIKVPVKFHFKDGSVIEHKFFLAKNHNDYLNEAKMDIILEWINKILTFSDKDFFNMVKISSGDYEQEVSLNCLNATNLKSSQMLATEAVYMAISMSNSNMFNVNATGSNDIEECILLGNDNTLNDSEGY